MQKTTNRDAVIEEIHRTRQQMADKFNGNLEAILEDARARQAASGRAIWQGPAPSNALDPVKDKT